MNDSVGTATTGNESAASLRALHRALFDLWQFGGNAVVGWTPTRFGIEVLTAPKMRLFHAKNLPERVFSGDRGMGQRTFAEVTAALGVEPVELRLPQPVGDGPDELPVSAIEPVFARFAVTKAAYRAVILIDIVGFSRFSPEEQACQLATLEFALNIAAEAAREQGLNLDIGRSTTGDGFYVWNRDKGFAADVNLFAALVLFQTYHSLLQRRVKIAAAVPKIRTAISIGSHYSYRQPDQDGTRDTEYIVGDVTISLARLMANAAADQIVVGDFQRPDDATGEMLSADRFVQVVANRLAEIKGLSILGNPLQRLAFYMTGPKLEDGSFGTQKLRIVDKHGFEHFGYNGKINIFLESGESFYCGLQHGDPKVGPG
jgi:class 3 adenylate cyclase